MMKKLLALPFVLSLLWFPVSANAGLLFFGTQDSIHFVANTTILGPGQSHLYLGQRVTMKAFLLPYYVENNGYVFGISGESKKYLPLPVGPELEALKSKGLLPNSLPPAELGWFDYVMGYSLWLALFFILGVPFLKKKVLGK
jgi:hypothetical protein